MKYLTERTPSSFFLRTVELLEAAYFAAHQHSETFDEPERRASLGHLRHHRCNDAFRKAGVDAGLLAVAPHTSPKGSRFSVVAADEIRFGRISIGYRNNLPRPSNFRRQIASLNSRLEPSNNDFFDEPVAVPEEGLGCLLITVNPERDGSQSVPAAILVGIPYSDLRAWHMLVPISEVLAAYHPAETVEVRDQAYATLKKIKTHLKDLEK